MFYYEINMTKKNTYQSKVFVLFFFVLVCVSPYIYTEDQESTNVIIISVDTLRADHLGCYGYPRNLSPAIDSLSRDGIRFSRCFTITPLTAPAFSTMLTSLPPHKHGAKKNGLGIFKHILTLPWYLKKKGYYTSAFISNWPLRIKLSGLHHEFDTYQEIFTRKRYLGIMNKEGTADVVTKKTFEWLEKHHKKKFFLWVQYTDPHAHYIFHPKFNPDRDKLKEARFPIGTRMHRIKKYDTEIAFTDFYIGKLIKNLKKLGLYRDALIIFNADHGESFGEHNYFKHGRKLYNSCLHIPLIIKLPQNQKRNTVNKKNVSILDVTPTILSILNFPIPDHMEGIPLLENIPERHLYFETYGGSAVLNRSNKYRLRVTPIRYGILRDSIKIIHSNKTRKKELFNLKEDWFEHHNLPHQIKNDYHLLSDQLTKYSKQVKKYIEYTKKKFKQRSQLSEEDYQKLKSLGYLN